MPDPEKVNVWIKIIRDILTSCLGGFMLYYETVKVISPNYLIMFAGLTLVGSPVLLRLDQFINTKPKGDKDA